MSAFNAELRKLLTLRSLRLTALLTALVSLAVPLRYFQAGFLVLGVLAAASEHQGGDQIRATLLAMPRRLPLLAAKVIALTAVTLPLAAVTAPPATVYLTLTTLLAAAVGSLLRRAEAATVLLLLAYFVALPLLHRWSAYLPGTAAAATAWTLGALALAGAAFHRRDA